MLIKDFLEHYVEGYLFQDLKNMEQIKLTPGQDKGAAGYPMLASALAGMELLGYLLMPDERPFDESASNDYFTNYWNNYFVKEEARYAGLCDVFRSLIRNGLAHTALTKHGIYVTKGAGQKVLVNAAARVLRVDVSVFRNELESSYAKHVCPIVDGTAKGALTTVEKMQGKLDSMDASYQAKSGNLFAALAKTRGQFADVIPQLMHVSTTVSISTASMSKNSSLPTPPITGYSGYIEPK